MTLKIYFKLLIALTFLSSCNGNAQDNSNSEAIKDSKAAELYQKAQSESRKGLSGWNKALEYLNEANELEPNNPIILHERAMLKIKSKIDVSGGFLDHQAAIDNSTDSLNKKMRYENRALDYLDCADICQACDDWKRSENAENYISKYCNRDFSNVIGENPDTNVTLKISLETDKVYITSQHNPNSMSSCYAEVVVKNINHDLITLKDGFLDYGLEYKNSSSLYLEAVDSNGVKFHFFEKGFSDTYGSNDQLKLDVGDEYIKNIDITKFHHFSRTGKYKVRVCLRPSKRTKGLKETYYSNWVEIEVMLQ